MAHRITLTARGPGAVVLLIVALVALFGVPRLIATPFSEAEASQAIRLFRSRQVSAEYTAQLNAAAPGERHTVGLAMAAALRKVNEEPAGVVRIRRSWLGPPFTYRWTHVVEARRDGEPPKTYRIRNGIAVAASRFWWYVPLF
jgi:hypothetical protein